MRQDLIIQVQDTPFGPRVSGPDVDRVVYSTNGEHAANSLPSLGEQVWSSADLDVFVVPVPHGVEIKIVTKAPPARDLALAA